MPRFNARLFADDNTSGLFGMNRGAASYLAGEEIQQTLAAATFAGAAKQADAFPADGVGKALFPNAAVGDLPGTDEAGDGIGVPPGNPTITVGAGSTIGTLQTIGDQDFYAIHLDAGVLYQIGLYGKTGGPNGVPLPDAYIQLYDASGKLIDVADGGGETPGGQLYGLDAMLTVEVETSGTYYINARAFDQDGTNGDTGDGVGDYELFARISTYDPYYSTFSPLYSIDWGTQVNKIHQSVRNPDGNEGPRNTGNPQGSVNYSDATALQTLATAQGKGDITGKNVITVYFAKAGEVYVDDDPTTTGTTETMVAKGFEAWEISAYKYAFAAYEKVADIVYLVVDNAYDALTHTAAADFTFVTYAGTSGVVGPSLLGRMSPPDTDNEGQSEFNANDIRWTQEGLAPGGFSFTTLIHEMGHGHGLAHPHDNGGHSGIMHGVESEGVIADYTNGDYDLNQSVYTMMSYEDGWEKSPYGQAESTDPFGWLRGLMGFDIAAIQDKYGVNEDTATGDDVYILEDTNHGTTFDANNNITQFASGFEAIWDAGGTDEIKYVGNRNTNIDLRAATLKYEYGGGGWISYATGVFGGFTIANGVTIENATGGNGNDTIHDNVANNRLDGGAGNDFFWVNAGGSDTVIGGIGNDVIFFGAKADALDAVDGGSGLDQIALQGGGGVAFGAGVVNIEALALLSGTDSRFGDTLGNLYDYTITTRDENVAAGAQLIVDGAQLVAGEDLTFNGSAETDGNFFIYGAGGIDNLTGGAKNDVFLFGAGGQWGSSDVVNGGGGIDQLALRGNYTIVFGAGQIIGIESIGLVSAQDTRFGPLGTDYSYNLTMSDANVAAGVQMSVDAAQLRGATETLTFNGAAETDGSFRVFGGKNGDSITTGAGADTLQGYGGADVLIGGGGADIFKYLSTSDSTAAAKDQILDFAPGTDKIDLSRIDANSDMAGDQAFAWIGSNAFSHTAGELRATLSNGVWTVEGDVNGDGTADLVIAVTTPGAAPLGAGDFLP